MWVELKPEDKIKVKISVVPVSAVRIIEVSLSKWKIKGWLTGHYKPYHYFFSSSDEWGNTRYYFREYRRGNKNGEKKKER